jgi:hypothetical protein
MSICGINPILDDPEINVTYDAILGMTDAEFLDYVQRMRSALRSIWDIQDIAPVRGWSEDEVREDFNAMSSFNANKFWHKDELTGRRVILNTHNVGNSVNAWNMSRMLKVRFNYTEDDNGRSIYQFFADDKLFKRYLPYARRHFLRDSFYFFAQTVKKGDGLPHFPEVKAADASEFCRDFGTKERTYGTHELLIEAKKLDKSYTGYAEHLKDAEFLVLNYDELIELVKSGVLPKITCRVIRANKELDRDHAFHVRLYEKGQKLFPAMFKSFRISMCSYAVNFPPLTAKLLYETFLKGLERDGGVMIWDPSAGWAGRLLAALSLDLRTTTNEFQPVRYIGTDPNPDFYADGNIYHDIGKFYNEVRGGASLYDETNRYLVMPYGSEVVQRDAGFQQLKGKLDIVFTSPPYFNREAYSEDENQSYKKFSSYDSWREGFLRPTLQTAYDWLAPERYLLWNIADLKVGSKYLPLEQDSIAIAKQLGFKFKETILMALKSMPGANRTTEDGTLTAKNFCKVDGRLLKFEPVHVFYKP